MNINQLTIFVFIALGVVSGCERETTVLAPSPSRTIDTNLIGEWIGASTVQDGDYVRHDTLHLSVSPDSASLFAGYAQLCSRYVDPNGSNIPICSDPPTQMRSFCAPAGNGELSYEIASPGVLLLGSDTRLRYTLFGTDSIRVLLENNGFKQEYGGDIVFLAKKYLHPTHQLVEGASMSSRADRSLDNIRPSNSSPA